MKVLLILNDPPYGTERSYNGLRLAGSLSARDGNAVRVFLMADAVGCGKAGQQVPTGYYSLERMLKLVLHSGGEVGACGSCLDARGLVEAELLSGVRKSSLEQLTDWTLWADRVITF